ncbi:hypothetical protein APSETT444_008757 [Aspergillus pseudonomiae]
MNPMLQQFQVSGNGTNVDAARDPNGTSSLLTTIDGPAEPRRNQACDVCRRMKIKCDRTKRSPVQPDRIEHLEKRLKAVEESCQQRAALTTVTPPIGSTDIVHSTQGNLNDNPLSGTSGRVPDVRLPSALENQGEARFLHSAAHMDFVRRLKDELGNWPGADAENRVRARDVPAPKFFPLSNGPGEAISLPSRDRAKYLVNLAFDAHFLHNFVHRPTFDSAFALLFTLNVKDYGSEEYRYLALLFSLMALGCLFEMDGEGYRDAFILEGQGLLRHLVSKETVRELDSELRSWLASLPPSLRLGQEKHPLHIERAQYELCMSYAHAQIYLYRPFLHYLGAYSTDEVGPTDGFPAYASACVDASRNIIRLAQDMYHKGLFRGVHWDISNMILASSLTMLYIVLARKGSSVEEMALAELRTARDLMTLLEPYSTLAKRTSFAVKLLTTAILPAGTSGLSPQNVVPGPSPNVSDSYTAALAEKTFGYVSRTNVSDYQGISPAGRQSNSVPVPVLTEIQSADSLPQGPLQTANTAGSATQGPSVPTAAQQSSTSTPFPIPSGMDNTPFVTGGIMEPSPLHSTYVQDYGISGDDYGYMIDGTGPIDFSDMIGDLFTSEGLL